MALIRQDEAIDRIVKIRPSNPKQSDYTHGIDVGLAMAMVAIKEQETITEPKQGKWLWNLAENGWADHICSECGWTKNTDIHVSLGYKFCPNCGSYNGGEQE